MANDLYLAQVLQYEYDREYDQQVNREERLFNGNSKGINCYANGSTYQGFFTKDYIIAISFYYVMLLYVLLYSFIIMLALSRTYVKSHLTSNKKFAEIK